MARLRYDSSRNGEKNPKSRDLNAGGAKVPLSWNDLAGHWKLCCLLAKLVL